MRRLVLSEEQKGSRAKTLPPLCRHKPKYHAQRIEFKQQKLNRTLEVIVVKV
ncbi:MULTISPECIES: hypothetical protein [Aeromonas]|uniref:hypothetical protein n=1 Tax=Aeromonas TaxID=642 RepID=UPI001375A191|nr:MULTISPECIES: hypothetical protein [Aeromonas]MDR7019611.1 hypothetical protein [Aeromonas salmonicida]